MSLRPTDGLARKVGGSGGKRGGGKLDYYNFMGQDKDVKKIKTGTRR